MSQVEVWSVCQRLPVCPADATLEPQQSCVGYHLDLVVYVAIWYRACLTSCFQLTRELNHLTTVKSKYHLVSKRRQQWRQVIWHLSEWQSQSLVNPVPKTPISSTKHLGGGGGGDKPKTTTKHAIKKNACKLHLLLMRANFPFLFPLSGNMELQRLTKSLAAAPQQISWAVLGHT
jgi:hypothetical protein